MTSIVEYKDSSLYNRKPLLLNGAPAIDSSQKVFGDASGYFPAGASVQYFHSSWQNLSANDWAWVFRLRFAALGDVVFISTGGVAANGYQFEYDNTNHLCKFTHTASGQVVTFAFTPSADVWYQLALVRKTNKLHLYKDGALVSSTALSPEITDHATNPLLIGAVSGAANIFLDDFVFQFGNLGPFVVDQAAFTPATGEITPDQYVSLYLKFNQVPVTFIESLFPADISFGSSGGPVSNTNIIVTKSGNEVRNVNWPQPIRRYQAQYGIRNHADLDAVLQMHLVCQGKAIGFRFKDWSDYKSCGISGTPAFGDQAIGTGDGTTKIFQLVKNYTFGGYSVARIIKKPVTGTVKIGINGANQASGWSVDVVHGLVYFDTAPGNGLAVTAGYEFDVPVRFDNDELSFNLAKPQLSGTSVALVEDMNENNR